MADRDVMQPLHNNEKLLFADFRIANTYPFRQKGNHSPIYRRLPIEIYPMDVPSFIWPSSCSAAVLQGGLPVGGPAVCHGFRDSTHAMRFITPNSALAATIEPC